MAINAHTWCARPAQGEGFEKTLNIRPHRSSLHALIARGFSLRQDLSPRDFSGIEIPISALLRMGLCVRVELACYPSLGFDFIPA